MDPVVLFILIDGIGDSGNKELEGETYLQRAVTPSLDKLMNCGLSGIMDPVETGLACGSDTAHMAIFGYSPYQHYQGRGSFETIGSGLELNQGEIAFKCNFATMDLESQVVVKRRVSRKFYLWGLEMIESINNLKIKGFEDYVISVKHATEHRCGLKITGPNLTHTIEGTDPLKDNLKLLRAQPWDVNDPNSVITANVVNAASDMIHSILSAHPINQKRIQSNKSPANVLLLRGAGVKLNVRNFDQAYQVKSFFIAPTAIIRGWGSTIGCPIIEVPGTTGDIRSNHKAKFETATELLKQGYDFGFLHIKAIDDLAHDKNLWDRISLLEKIDAMIGETLEKLNNTVVVVTGDHTTNVHIGDHSFEPVPFVIAWSGLYQNSQGPLKFNEIDSSKGSLGRFPGSEVMPLILRYKTHIKNTFNS